MAARRTYKRDKRGRFASTGHSRVKRVGKWAGLGRVMSTPESTRA